MDSYFKKVIIWGFPLHSHTHSYVHYGWYKAFHHLGYETHWFHDEYPVPSSFDFTHCLFITEGYADERIPLHPSNIYFVHVARYPLKYLQVGARFIDIRYHVSSIRDCNYIYDTAQKQLQSIGNEVTLYEPYATDRDLHPQFRNPFPLTYEAAYICWATDLLPHEINLEDRFLEPEQVCYFIGSVGNGNRKEIEKLARGCAKYGVEIRFNDPWKNPLDFEDAKQLVQRSCIAPDIRGSGDPYNMSMGETGTCHKNIGYIPCRLFKNISYGKVGGTNCPRLQRLFGDMVVFHEDEEQLATLCFEKEKDKEYIKQQMIWVRDHHTYVNRVYDILDIIRKKPYSS